MPKLININVDKIQRHEVLFLLVPHKSWATVYLCCQFISDDVTWGPFLLYVPYKSWSLFYAINLFLMIHCQMNWNCNQAMIMTRLITNLGGDSGGGGGGAELANRGMSPWTGCCQCFSHLAHDLVQVLFLHLHHILWLVDLDVALLIFLGSCWTVLPHVSPDLGGAQTPAVSFTLPVLTKNWFIVIYFQPSGR